MAGPASARPLIVHGTTVAVAGVGVLLRGASGSGKSDLALRLIDEGAALVSDDMTELARDGAGLVARHPTAGPAGTRGRIEARGVGIVPVEAAAQAPLGLVVDLVEGAVERLPEQRVCAYLGVTLPCVALRPFEASAAAKLRAAVRALAPARGRACAAGAA